MAIQKIAAGNREDWLEMRKQDVTASAASALLGAHPFMTAFELWHIKNGTRREDPEMSEQMLRGVLLEPVAVKLMRMQFPKWRIIHNSEEQQFYFRDVEKRIGATPDVMAITDTGETATVQIKSVDPQTFQSKWLVSGKLSAPDSWVIEPPAYIVVQAIIEAVLTGSELAYVAPLVVMRGLHMPVVPVPVHLKVYTALEAAIVEFWASIREGREPAPDWQRDEKLLMEFGRTDNGEEIDLAGDNRMPVLLQERFDRKQQIKTLETELEEIEGEIIGKLGEYERANVPGWIVKRSTVHRKGYEAKPTQFRQFKITRV